MVILWVCYGYPMVLTAVYTIIHIIDLKKGASHRRPVVVFYARISGIDPPIKHRIYSILQKSALQIWYFQKKSCTFAAVMTHAEGMRAGMFRNYPL